MELVMSQQLQNERERDATVDAASLSRVVQIASEIKHQEQGRLTVQDIEAIGAEFGLEPELIRRALDRMEEESRPAVRPRRAARAGLPLVSEPFVRAWWAAGWTIPFFLAPLGGWAFNDAGAILGFVGGWAAYIGFGVYFGGLVEERRRPQRGKAEVSREALLDALFTLRRQLEGQRRHRAFLSIDVVGSSLMKRSGEYLDVEYSFRRYQQWAVSVVEACGGRMQSAAGDGSMCVFERERDAVRAARRLQEEIGEFNRRYNQLPERFVIRCGVSAGTVAVDDGTTIGHLQSPVVDRAALLQRSAEPGQVVIGAELAAAAMAELGRIEPRPREGLDPAFVWPAIMPGAARAAGDAPDQILRETRS